jgi:hypothetical protein
MFFQTVDAPELVDVSRKLVADLGVDAHRAFGADDAARLGHIDRGGGARGREQENKN